MRNYIFICFILMGFLAQAQEDPRDAFIGHYRYSGYTIGYPSGKRDTIIDKILVYLKHPEDSSKIYVKQNSETVIAKTPLYFFAADSSFDYAPSIPKQREHGYFYGVDSAYHYFFQRRPLGMPQHDIIRYYLWGKWIKPLGTGIEELNLQVHTFPNPTKDRVQFSGVTPSSYVLYSLSGKQLKAGQVKNREVSLHELPQGVYLLQLQVGEETVVKRIIQQ